MKRFLIVFFICFCSKQIVFSQALELWQSLLKKKELVTYFQGTFESLGIRITETGEKLTVYHRGDHFEINPGYDSLNVDYFIELKSENVQNLVKHDADQQISAGESFQILSVLFSPWVSSSLRQQIFSEDAKMKLAGVENLIHVYLDNPGTNEFVVQTLVYVNKEWLVIPGIYGKAKRIFHLTPDQALEYQRHFFKAQKTNTRQEWKNCVSWYLKWRKTVSIKAD